MEAVNCLRCEYKDADNGNCTAAGGFCTAVPAAHCPLLRQYLGTGMTPEQAANAKTIIESAFAEDTSKAERIRKLLAADKEGRVLILPCKRGDGIYICSAGRAWRFWVTDVSTLNGRTVLNVQGFGTIAADDVGKTAFLSLEEAERALEEQKNV
jgi:hypothetical protein